MTPDPPREDIATAMSVLGENIATAMSVQRETEDIATAMSDPRQDAHFACRRRVESASGSLEA